jgi:cold shock CspA family protein
VRKRGVVAAFSRKRNFLLIKPDGEDRSVFCHHSDLTASDSVIKPGTKVEFMLFKADCYEARKVKAIN